MSDAQFEDQQFEDQESLHNEPGLSSAMHDIRMLARSYQDKAPKLATHGELELGGVSMNPNFLLLPKAPSPRESWKNVALVMMVLLGLSTSALALTLYTDTDEGGTEPTVPTLQLDATAPLPRASQVPAIVMAPEPAIYAVTSRPMQPEAHKATAPVITKPARAPVPQRTIREPANSCDEVACLLDGSDPCCEAYPSVRSQESAIKEAPSRPYRPTRLEIMTPMSSLNGRVTACYDKYAYKGVALVSVVISPAGRVSSVALDDGSPAFQSCVSAHVSGLTFPELSQPFTFSYPFTF